MEENFKNRTTMKRDEFEEWPWFDTINILFMAGAMFYCMVKGNEPGTFGWAMATIIYIIKG